MGNGNRFKCAQETASVIISDYYTNDIGDSVDFGVAADAIQKGFELYKVKEYARQVHDRYYNDIDIFYNYHIK